MNELESCANLGRNRHWVILETGSNQAFIFATNKQRVNVGASELIRRSCTEWVNDAIDDLSDRSMVTPVVRASGKAILLVRDEQLGRDLIGAVTRRAIVDAPGLELWGTCGPDVAADFADAASSLEKAHHLHGSWRGFKRSTRGRHPMLPPLRTCRVGTGPATDVRKDPDAEASDAGLALGPTVARTWDLSRDARRRLKDDLPGADIDRVVPDLHRGQELGHDGWIAVVHADGNKIGNLFLDLGEHYQGHEFVRTLAALSDALDRVTRASLDHAVTAIPRTDRPWLVPLIVGGDDVTFLADARVAVRLLREFLTAFEEASARDEVIARVTRAIRGRDDAGADEADLLGLTASAGLAFVKPHHPFADAYDLVEHLVLSAKTIGRAGTVPPKGVSALDFHVCYESVSTPLPQVREQLTTLDPSGRALRLWGGPYRISPAEAPARTDDDLARVRDLADAARAVDLFADAGAARVADRDPLLSNAQAHALRSALLIGGGEIDRVRDRIRLLGGRALAPSPATDQAALLDGLIADDPHVDGGQRTLLLDALSLADALTGTGEAASNTDRQDASTIGASS